MKIELFSSQEFSERLVPEVCAVVRELTETHADVRALLLECSLLPPYAAVLQKQTGLPVFDYTSLIDMVHTALNRNTRHYGPFPNAVSAFSMAFPNISA